MYLTKLERVVEWIPLAHCGYMWQENNGTCFLKSGECIGQEKCFPLSYKLTWRKQVRSVGTVNSLLAGQQRKWVSTSGTVQ